jgi:hypothetical protein
VACSFIAHPHRFLQIGPRRKTFRADRADKDLVIFCTMISLPNVNAPSHGAGHKGAGVTDGTRTIMPR